MTEQLKPCPFCGGLAKAYERTCDKSDRYDPSHRAYPIVRCGSCGCCAEGKDWTEPDTAIEAWNRRVHPAQPGAEPAPSAVVCGRCDGTGLDARYCNYQCEKCEGSGQAGAEPVALSPEFTDTARAALLWVLWHHQGSSSPIGQPIRFALGMGAHQALSAAQVAEAKRWAAQTGSTTVEFHTNPPARVPLTEGELLSMWSGGDERFMRPVLGKNKVLAFAHAAIAAYEAKNGIGGGK